jgi:hypothetical protein
MALRALDTVKYHTKYYRNLPTLDRHSLGTKFKTLSPLANPTRARARARRGPLARSRWPAAAIAARSDAGARTRAPARLPTHTANSAFHS